MKKIKIDIVSDSVCPWCYVGISNLEKAMESLKDQYEFELSWNPFQLNPDISEEGIAYKDYLEKKFGNRTNEAKKTVIEKGLQAGITFNFDAIEKVANTLKSHYLVALSRKENKQTITSKALFKAYFEEGKDINSIEELKLIGKSVGLSDSITSVLDKIEEKDLLPLVKLEEGFRELGITSVPSFIIENQYLVQGAQEPSVFEEIINKIENADAEEESSCGCGPEGC